MSNTETIKKNFSRYARQYDNYANIQNQSAEKLIETIEKKQFDKILDIGCGTGCYTKLLQNHFPAAKIKALDISSEMINVAKDKLAHSNIDFLIADGQKIALDEKFDLITSNACFQWFDNFQQTLAGYKNMLTSNGIILFSIFGPKTFNELSRSLQILYELDVPISSDFFLSEDEITNLLEKYFSQTDIQQQTIKKTYKSLQQLLNTIKYTGTRGLGLNGKVLTRKQIGQLEEIYKNKFKGIAATYEIFYCRAVKKD